jgi:hypothetical protein
MLGLGISALAIPVAVSQGWRARRLGLPDGRKGVAGLGMALGLFAIVVPAALAVSALMAPPPPPPLPAIACDCRSVAPVTFEMRLGDPAGVPVGRRGGGTVTVQAEPFLSLADLQSATPWESAMGEGRTSIGIELTPEAASRLAARAVPGSMLAILVDGECVSFSTVEAALGSPMALELPLTRAESCGLHCGAREQAVP